MFPHLNVPVPHSSVRFLLDALPADIETHPFTWNTALRADYDVLHVHWPEGLLRGTSPARVLLQRLRFLALAARLTINNTPVIWSVHDDSPLEKGPLGEGLFLALWDKLTTRRIYMYNSARPRPHSARDVMIPHGCYSPLFPDSRDARREKIVPGRVVLFGHIRPYKGIEEFLSTMAEMTTSNRLESDVSLLIAGRDTFRWYTKRLRQLASSLPNVTIRAEYLDDDDVEELLLTAEAVVLPYQKIYNSGVALLALTLKRPIIVQQSPTMAELATEVGGSWVTVMPFPASAADFGAAHEVAREAHGQGVPDLSQRAWADIGQRYADVFRSADTRSSQLLLK